MDKEVKKNIWSPFIKEIEKIDPLLNSIFKAANYAGFNCNTNVLTIVYQHEFSFFNEMLENTASIWRPFLKCICGKDLMLEIVFESPK